MKRPPNLSQAKRALRLWRSSTATKQLQRRNAMKWLAATDALGSRWVLAGREEVKWGNGGSAP